MATRRFTHFAAAVMVTAATVLPQPNVSAQELLNAGDILQLPTPEADHRVSYGPDPLQFGDLYLPDGPGPHSVLAFIHGGCFLSAFDLSHAAGLARTVADRGYAVWSIEYRRPGNDGGVWPNTFKDVGMGLDHLSELATEYPLDMDRIVVSGHSAGGTLALWAAGRDKIPESSDLFTEDPLEVDAVLGLAAVGDLEGVQMLGVCGNVVDQLMGGTPAEVPRRYAAASPMKLAPISKPTTLVMGLQDDAWTPPSRSYLYRAITVGAEDIEVVELPASGHFEMIVPSTGSFRAVLQALEATFARIGAGGS